MKDIVLSCDNLLKQYPVKKGMFNKVVGQKNIVDHVSLELEKGKTLAIVGESCWELRTRRTEVSYLKENPWTI